MTILVWLLTFFLIINCLLLILLVLIQLPKKEAGLGQAFGGATTDALFGAGSGTALTKLTKYCAGIFFVLTLVISLLHGHMARAKTRDLRPTLSAEDKLSLTAPAPAKTNAPAAPAAPAAPGTNQLKLITPVPATNSPAPIEKK